MAIVMASRAATCEGSSTDCDVANLPDIPFHPPLTYNVNLAKEGVLNAHVSDHGLVSGDGSIIAKTKMPCFAMFVYRP